MIKLTGPPSVTFIIKYMQEGNMKKIILTSLLSFAVIFSGCIQEEFSPNDLREITSALGPPAKLELNIGETANTSKIEVTIKEVKKVDYYTYSTISNETFIERPSRGNVFLLIKAEIKNIGNEAKYIWLDDFTVRDSKNLTYNPEFYLGEGKLESKELHPNERIKGNMLFEVPESATGLEVLYDFRNANASLAKWKIPESEPERLASVRSANIKIEEIEYEPPGIITIEGDATFTFINYPGSISGLNCTIKNTGKVPIHPIFDIEITYRGKEKITYKREIYSKVSEKSLFPEKVDPSWTVKNKLLVYISDLEYGLYTVKVDLRDGDDPTVLDNDSKTILIG